MMKCNSRTIQAVFLISGTAIGAGMLALPMQTAGLGLWWPIGIFILTWLVSYYAGLYMLEANMVEHEGCNLLTMVSHAYGSWGRWLVSILYLMLLYSVTAAYLGSLADMMEQYLKFEFPNHNIPYWLTTINFALIFAFLMGMGTSWVGRVNEFLFFMLMLALLILAYTLGMQIDFHRLSEGQYNATTVLAILPVTVTAFAYQIVVPSVRTFLRSDIKQLKIAIFWGSVLPLVFYCLWEVVLLLTIPLEGRYGLLALKDMGMPFDILQSLTHTVNSANILGIGAAFILLAVLTSFIGVSLSLFHFLRDALSQDGEKVGVSLTLCLTFVPPLFFVLIFPRGFQLALQLAGALVAILLVILPTLLFWRKRSLQLADEIHCAPDSVALRVAMLLFAVLVLFAMLGV
jgi:tyrosine-specific transport protein